MQIAAYCRVSTDKEDQLNSLEKQKEFFREYAERNNHHLARLYADEGISGTKIKKRREFQRMMADAERGLFEMVVVKDISRFARNTVDLLESVRRLKALGIEVQFLTAQMTSMGGSEFVLTVMGALAQEESANMSKRVKFGKKMNAQKGRVPNIVYGYDKIKGEYFTLHINQEEAAVVRRIFQWYNHEGLGSARIANRLNEMGLLTKRGCRWSQNAVGSILANALYTGRIINGKQEVSDFLTGKRVRRDEEDWLVVDRPELRIISREEYDLAQKTLRERYEAFHLEKTRHSNRYLFSTIIKCKDCGWSFCRTVRTYKNTYIRWCCSGHNGRGADSCPNAVTVDEDQLIDMLQQYFRDILAHKKQVMRCVVGEFQRTYQSQNENVRYEKDLTQKLNKLKSSREKYIHLYTDELITRQELNERIGKTNQEIEQLEKELAAVRLHLTRGRQLERILNDTFREPENIADVRSMTNTQLKRIVSKILVDHQGHVEIYLKPLGEPGSEQTVPVYDDRA